PRPLNAFMFFRLWCQSKINRSVESDHRIISRISGHYWRMLPQAEKDIYYAMAEKAKIEHSIKYPNYRYAP
ncbi:hypothetical protein L218DRAFT_825636, partial [Marasmius fiardii PR-910]